MQSPSCAVRLCEEHSRSRDASDLHRVDMSDAGCLAIFLTLHSLILSCR
jgi:hypothetical protein